MTGILLCDVYDWAERGIREESLPKVKGVAQKPKDLKIKMPVGRKNDKVKIISYSAPVYIVEGPKERYPVHESDILTENLNDGKKEKKSGL